MRDPNENENDSWEVFGQTMMVLVSAACFVGILLVAVLSSCSAT